MDGKPAVEQTFNVSAERRASEREILIRQMSDKDQRQVAEIRQQHERDVLERRQLQGANLMEDIRKERERLVREHFTPAPRPSFAMPFQRSAAQIERQAAKRVEYENTYELKEMAKQRDATIDQLLQDRGQSYDQFKPEREQIEQQRAQAKQINDPGREL